MKVYWLEQELADVPPGDRWLSPAEAAIAAAMRFAKRRADWRLGRWTAKCAVARLHPQALESIEIRAAKSGAPEVFFDGKPAPVSVSITHSGGRSACAVSPGGVALGCDLETVEPRSDQFAADYFTYDEQLLVARAPASDRSSLLTLLWSAKESVLKALREGLRLDTRSIVITPQYTLDAWHPFTARYAERQKFHGWWQRPDDIVRTVAASRPFLPPVLGAGISRI